MHFETLLYTLVLIRFVFGQNRKLNMLANAHADVSNLNLQMLMHFQSMLRESPAEAQIRYGYTTDQAQTILAMDQGELKNLASSGVMLFTLQVPTTPHLKVVSNA